MIQQQTLKLHEKIYLKVILNRELYILKTRLKKLEQCQTSKNRLILPYVKLNKGNVRELLNLKVIRPDEIKETKTEIETLDIIRAKLLLI